MRTQIQISYCIQIAGASTYVYHADGGVVNRRTSTRLLHSPRMLVPSEQMQGCWD